MKPADIKNVEIRDEFWSRKQALVRKEVIPYQWEILNDRIPEAEASYCMHNFKAAGILNEKMRKKGDAFEAPRFTYRGFAVFPEKREAKRPTLRRAAPPGAGISPREESPSARARLI